MDPPAAGGHESIINPSLYLTITAESNHRHSSVLFWGLRSDT